MNLAGLPPIGQKVQPLTAKEKREGKKHMGRVKQLPCVICQLFGMTQNSPTEVHHWKSGRYGQKRTPDSEAIPLCHSHHNKLRPYPGDEDKVGFHNAQETWERLYGPDYGFIPVVRAALSDMELDY
ncbi:Ref family recombination enhancement nuclease [Ruegeria jejuensis]|uniref:Ref family recombination enhancement nuclease n=1 Tax=Ruegeria jejuensis TaxID=3233338 RepID=UPI00355C7AD6